MFNWYNQPLTLCCCPLQLVECGRCCICVTCLPTIFQSFLMLLKLSTCSTKPGKILLRIIRTPLAFWLVVMPLSLLAAGHTLVINWLWIWMTRLILNIGSIQFVVKWMTCYVIFGKRQSIVKLHSWWKYTVKLVFMALYYGTWVILQLLPLLHGGRAYGGFGGFHTVHIGVYCILWAVTCHYLMNCVVELLCLLRAA